MSKPDGNVELTLHAGPVLHVLEDVDRLLAVTVDVDWTPVHLRERLQDIHQEKNLAIPFNHLRERLPDQEIKKWTMQYYEFAAQLQ